MHIIVNNQIGFTTQRTHGRSGAYSSDVVKMLECPVIHVNAEDPEVGVHTYTRIKPRECVTRNERRCVFLVYFPGNGVCLPAGSGLPQHVRLRHFDRRDWLSQGNDQVFCSNRAGVQDAYCTDCDETILFQHGHNEVDEPSFTQPVMYKNIRSRPSVVTKYTDTLKVWSRDYRR